MTSKKVTNKSIEKKVKPEKSKSEQYVESVLKLTGTLDKIPSSGRRHYYDDNYLEAINEDSINDYLYDLPEDDVLNASKKLTEQTAFNILKKNKKVQEKIDHILKNVAMCIVSETSDVSKSILSDRKYAKIALEKNKEELKKREEAKKKLVAEKAMFKESLTGKQKQFIKKLLKVDVNKI
jgi:hypothetical protein